MFFRPGMEVVNAGMQNLWAILVALNWTYLPIIRFFGLIERRFKNKKMLVTNYLNRSFNQSVIITEHAGSLKKFRDGTK